MSDYGVRFWDASGNLTFDSTADNVLFYQDERSISGSTVAAGNVVIDYPELAGKKISAFLQCPYGSTDIAGQVVQSCRITYPSGVPRVTVSAEGSYDGFPPADGYLIVMWTGGTQ